MWTQVATIPLVLFERIHRNYLQSYMQISTREMAHGLASDHNVLLEGQIIHALVWHCPEVTHSLLPQGPIYQSIFPIKKTLKIMPHNSEVFISWKVN